MKNHNSDEKKLAKQAQDFFDKNSKVKNDTRRIDMTAAAKAMDKKENLRKIEPFRDAQKKADTHGGKASDFDKVKTESFGNVQVHGVHNNRSGKILEKKFAHLDVRQNAADMKEKKVEKIENKRKKL